MKKIILLSTLLAFSATTFAQLELGVDGAVNTTWFLNNNVSDQGPNLNPNFSIGGSGGVTGSFFFTKSVGLGIEINLNSVNQKYDGTAGSSSFNATDHVNYIQVPIMLKLKTESGFFLELGPEANFSSSAKGKLESSPANEAADYSGRDIKTGFSSSVMGIVFGFGGRFPVTDHIVITGGLRFFGGLSDATTEFSEAEFTQHLLADEIGVASYYAHHDQEQNFSYQKTSMVTGGIQLGLLYAIGKNQKKDSGK